MASMAALSKPLVNMRGPVGDILRSTRDGLGAGTIANIFDKKVLKGKLTSSGIGLGQSINGKPVTLNGTDVVTLLITNGLKVPTKGSIISTGITLAIKKWAEAFDYIDPPQTLPTSDPRATNVTLARMQRDGRAENFNPWRSFN